MRLSESNKVSAQSPRGRLADMEHRSARILAASHAFVQNLRRGHCDIATEATGPHRLRTASNDLAL